MTSINTNSSAMAALANLQSTNSMMETTQNRISTGLRITTASDNAAYWSISATMKSDNSALSTVKDALGLGSATIDVAYTAMEASTNLVTEIKNKLVAAREPGVDRGKIQDEIGQLQEQLKSVANSASFSGENWLSVDSTEAGYAAKEEIVSSYTRGSDGKVTIGKIEVDKSDIKLIDATTTAADKGLLDKATDANNGGSGKSVLNLTVEGTTAGTPAVTTPLSNADIDTLINEVAAVETSMIDATASLGSAKNRINLQNDFIGNLMDAIDRGVGQLVDADMTEESSKLKSLQVQQQLGIQSLSIANSNAQNILSLFR